MREICAFEAVAENGAVVPARWRPDVASGLPLAVRRRRIDTEARNAALADPGLLDITIDAETNAHAWAATGRLADAHRLTVYDASYLELAARNALPLASRDDDLRMAAERLSVTLLGKGLRPQPD